MIYRLDCGIVDPASNPKTVLGGTITVHEPHADSEDRIMHPGQYHVVGHRAYLSTTADDGSRVTLHQIELADANDYCDERWLLREPAHFSEESL